MIEEFKNYMRDLGKSENTIKSYVIAIREYLKFIQIGEEEFTTLHRVNILEYRSYLLNVKGVKDKTLNAKLSALKLLGEYLISIGRLKEQVVLKTDYKKVQQPFISPATITKSDVDEFRARILNQPNKRADNRDDKEREPDEFFHDFKVLRDYCIVTFMAYAGLRVSECLNLKLADFQQVLPNGNLYINTDKVIVRDGKGGRDREFVMFDEVIEPLKAYLKQRTGNSPYLFASRQGQKLNRTTINRLFNQYSDTITPHGLRHFLVSWLLNEKGFTIPEVMYITGHSDPKTLMIYTHPSIAALKEKARR